MSSKKIAITGGTGLIGRALCEKLKEAGHEVLIVSRNPEKADILWDIAKGTLEAEKLEGLNAVFHLAGEPIARRWTGKAREEIYRSRIESTRLLVDAFRKIKQPPSVLISASGINYYKNTELGAALDEEAAPGTSFLSRVCLHWEEQARRAESMGVRVCLLRTSAVLSPDGGALEQLLPVFRKGMGGRVGNGKQPFSWIALDDYVSICLHLLQSSEATGAYNVVSPGVVDNAEFVKALGKVLQKPSMVPLPGFAVRLSFGEMGRFLLLEGVDARPERLKREGFTFDFPTLPEALAHLLPSK